VRGVDGYSWPVLQDQVLRSLVAERDGGLRLQLLAFVEQHAAALVQSGGRDAVLGLSRYDALALAWWVCQVDRAL
jgi:hypothetical protein